MKKNRLELMRDLFFGTTRQTRLEPRRAQFTRPELEAMDKAVRNASTLRVRRGLRFQTYGRESADAPKD